MNVVRFADGVTLLPTSAVVRMLAAFHQTARDIGHDITVTAGSNGTHSSPEDPHYKGLALDTRTHDLPDPHEALLRLMDNLLDFPGDEWVAKDGGFVTAYFFAWLEQEGQPREHIHCQLRKGMSYPPLVQT